MVPFSEPNQIFPGPVVNNGPNSSGGSLYVLLIAREPEPAAPLPAVGVGVAIRDGVSFGVEEGKGGFVAVFVGEGVGVCAA